MLRRAFHPPGAVERTAQTQGRAFPGLLDFNAGM